MNKKKYQKPAMRVVKLQRYNRLLQGSNPDYWGYTAPGTDDRNHLA